MPDVLTIPAELTPVLRREAIDRYDDAAERAHLAAHAVLVHDNSAHGQPDDRAMELAGELCKARVALNRHEALLDELADDIYTAEPWTIDLDRNVREALAAVIDQAMELTDKPGTPQEIVALGRRTEVLLALRAELEPESAPA